MSGKLHQHIRQNVVGYVAIFLFAIGGTAYATHPGGADTISTEDIINGQVLTQDIGVGEVNNSDLAPDSVPSSKIVNGTIQGADVADNALAGGQIDESTLFNDNSLTAGDLATDSAQASEVGANAIDQDEIEDGSVGSAEIGTDQVGSSEIAANAVAGSEIGSAAVGATEVADDSLGLQELKIGARHDDTLDLFNTPINNGACSSFANASAPAIGNTASGALTFVTNVKTSGWRVEGTTTTTSAAKVRLCNRTGVNLPDAPPVTFSWITLDDS